MRRAGEQPQPQPQPPPPLPRSRRRALSEGAESPPSATSPPSPGLPVEVAEVVAMRAGEGGGSVPHVVLHEGRVFFPRHPTAGDWAVVEERWGDRECRGTRRSRGRTARLPYARPGQQPMEAVGTGGVPPVRWVEGTRRGSSHSPPAERGWRLEGGQAEGGE